MGIPSKDKTLSPRLFKRLRPEIKEGTILRLLFFACFVVVAFNVEKIGWALSAVLFFLILVVGGLAPVKPKMKSRSYRLELIIEPHWYDIFERLLPGLQRGEDRTIVRFLTDLNDPRPDTPFVNHEFVVFEHSDGLRTIWHDNSKSFVQSEELLIRLFVYWDTEERASRRLDAFAAKDELFAQLISKPLMKNNLVKLMCKHDLSKEGELLKIHPVGVNFAVHGPIGDIVDAKHLCSIPHWDIISFLTDLDRHTSGGAMHGIKTFPEHLRKKFAKEGVAYCDETRFHNIEYNSEMEFSDRISNYVDEKWNREKGVVIYSSYLRHHWFSAKYFSVGMHIQFFDEPDEEMRQLLQ